MFRKLIFTAAMMYAVAGVAQTTPACSVMTLGTNGSLNGFVPSPNDAWHQDITTAPIDPSSTKIITTSGDLAGAYLHPDFGSGVYGYYGIPYNVVDSATTPEIPVPIVLYPSESDIAPIPIPPNMAVEGNVGECPTDNGDRHAVIIDRTQCVAYELYQAGHCNSQWTGSIETIWDLSTTEKRPYGYTSADAAGLSIFEGVIRYDEIMAGKINHAIRFTAVHTKDNANNGYFTAPATHAAGTLWGTDNIIGMRIRLKASFDISGFSATNQIILKAMKQYGMILADNGSNLFFQGTPDTRWNDDDLSALKKVPASAFDVVQMAPVYDSTTAPTGPAPIINSFTASQTSVASGTSVTLTPVVTGASYSYIDKTGFTRGPVTVKPTTTTTYTLTSRNQFGTTSAAVTVTVTGSTSTPKLVFAPNSGETFGTGAFVVSATSASTGAVTYSIMSGPGTVSGNAVTATGVGTIVVKATQAAAGTYSAASATLSIPIKPGVSSLAFVPVPALTYPGAPYTLETTTNSAGSISYAVYYGPATVSGNQVTTTGTGVLSLIATQAASGNYVKTTVYSNNIRVSAGSTTISIAPIPAKTLGNPPFAVTTTSPSPAPIVYAVSGPATISGSTITLTGAGTVTVVASQVAQGTYSAASASVSFTVSAGTAIPALVFAPKAAQTFGAGAFAVSASSASTGAVTYSIASGPGTIAGNNVTATGVGTIVVKATQAAAGTYSAASATLSVPIKPGIPSLAFVPVPTLDYGQAPYILQTTSNSTGSVTYSVYYGPATVSGNMVTTTGSGALSLSATQAAAGNYAAVTVFSNNIRVVP